MGFQIIGVKFWTGFTRQNQISLTFFVNPMYLRMVSPFLRGPTNPKMIFSQMFYMRFTFLAFAAMAIRWALSRSWDWAIVKLQLQISQLF